MRKIQVKNKWLAHQDFMNDFYSAVDKCITYENTSAKEEERICQQLMCQNTIHSIES